MKIHFQLKMEVNFDLKRGELKTFEKLDTRITAIFSDKCPIDESEIIYQVTPLTQYGVKALIENTTMYFNTSLGEKFIFRRRRDFEVNRTYEFKHTLFRNFKYINIRVIYNNQ